MDLNDNVPITVSEALLENDGTIILVTGVVVGEFEGTVVIQDSTGAALFVPANVGGALGDEIVLIGELATDTAYSDNQRQLVNATKIETVATGVALVTSTETDVATIISETPLMQRYTAELTVSGYDGYGFVLLNGIKFNLDEAPVYFEDLYPAGESITLTFTVVDVDYGTTRVVSVEGFPTADDAYMVERVAAALTATIPTTVTGDITLPTDIQGVTIAWASANAQIGVDGTVTRPVAGTPDVTGDLTATITLNAESDTVVISVTVLAYILYDNMESFTNFDLTGSSYGEGSYVGDNAITWAYTESRGDFTLTDKAIMLDKDGDGASLKATIAGGIGAISIDYHDAYSGPAEVIIIINEGLAGEITFTSPVVDFDESGSGGQYATFEVAGINIVGEFTISIYSGGSQMVLDNLEWTGYTE